MVASVLGLDVLLLEKSSGRGLGVLESVGGVVHAGATWAMMDKRWVCLLMVGGSTVVGS